MTEPEVVQSSGPPPALNDLYASPEFRAAFKREVEADTDPPWWWFAAWRIKLRAMLPGQTAPPESESPILAFQAWCQRYTDTHGPMTQDQYFLAQAAFYSAHPGKGPSSQLQSQLAAALDPVVDARNSEEPK